MDKMARMLPWIGYIEEVGAGVNRDGNMVQGVGIARVLI